MPCMKTSLAIAKHQITERLRSQSTLRNSTTTVLKKLHTWMTLIDQSGQNLLLIPRVSVLEKVENVDRMRGKKAELKQVCRVHTCHL